MYVYVCTCMYVCIYMWIHICDTGHTKTCQTTNTRKSSYCRWEKLSNHSVRMRERKRETARYFFSLFRLLDIVIIIQRNSKLSLHSSTPPTERRLTDRLTDDGRPWGINIPQWDRIDNIDLWGQNRSNSKWAETLSFSYLIDLVYISVNGSS